MCNITVSTGVIFMPIFICFTNNGKLSAAEPLEPFGKTANQLLQDVQERLVFRANLYLTSDILNYRPSAGDLAYPEKLVMMENIAISLQEPVFRRSDSQGSIASVASMDVEMQHRTRSGSEFKTLGVHSCIS